MHEHDNESTQRSSGGSCLIVSSISSYTWQNPRYDQISTSYGRSESFISATPVKQKLVLFSLYLSRTFHFHSSEIFVCDSIILLNAKNSAKLLAVLALEFCFQPLPPPSSLVVLGQAWEEQWKRVKPSLIRAPASLPPAFIPGYFHSEDHCTPHNWVVLSANTDSWRATDTHW